jgi:ribosomal protein S18 acetylase RimI-like enzyme
MKIIQTKNSEYKADIINLYIEAFSTGKSEQFIDEDELNKYIDSILKNGYALLAIENDQPIGAVLICQLTLDNAHPKEISDRFNAEKCLYIAEMMVATSARGKGIGQRLMEAFEETADKTRYSDTFIRVWTENTPAVRLYTKMGFETIASIEQTKKTVDGGGTFVMQKIYLHKKLN